MPDDQSAHAAQSRDETVPSALVAMVRRAVDDLETLLNTLSARSDRTLAAIVDQARRDDDPPLAGAMVLASRCAEIMATPPETIARRTDMLAELIRARGLLNSASRPGSAEPFRLAAFCTGERRLARGRGAGLPRSGPGGGVPPLPRPAAAAADRRGADPRPEPLGRPAVPRHPPLGDAAGTDRFARPGEGAGGGTGRDRDAPDGHSSRARDDPRRRERPVLPPGGRDARRRGPAGHGARPLGARAAGGRLGGAGVHVLRLHHPGAVRAAALGRAVGGAAALPPRGGARAIRHAADTSRRRSIIRQQ
jgi:hypothetical protein